MGQDGTTSVAEVAPSEVEVEAVLEALEAGVLVEVEPAVVGNFFALSISFLHNEIHLTSFSINYLPFDGFK